ncbi:MAG: hypothetical protein AB1453_05125 [Chloroflexota bacterium]
MLQRAPRQTLFLALVIFLFLLPGGCGGAGITITIENQTGQPICEVYISPQDNSDFGRNKLEEGDPIEHQETRAFPVTSGEYDLLARNCQQETVFAQSGVTTDARFVVGSQGAQPLRLHNQTSDEICYIYFSPADSGAWGEDQLARVESILPGGLRIFYQPAGMYHVRAAGCDDRTIAEARNVNLNAPFDWVISP